MMAKKRLSQDQEFQIMKMVLDKFLWIGFGIMLYGVYRMFTQTITDGISWVISGAILLILFIVIIVREYEIIR